MGDATADFLQIWKTPTERDQQRLIGASNLSNLCSYCLAKDMLGEGTEEPSRYWMGARVGTAIHAENAMLVERYFPEHKAEIRVSLGEIPGYGLLGSTSDWFVPEDEDVRDVKTTTREKLPIIKRAVLDDPHPKELTKVRDTRAKVNGYWNQVDLYGLGAENAGYTVKTVTLLFVCRDGSTDNDVWHTSKPYDRQRALDLMDRGELIWSFLQNGGTLDEIESHESCYPCGVAGRS